MNLLLDTHVVLWWLADDPSLAPAARQAIGQGRNLVYISAASVWEIVIKQALGKLAVPAEFRDILGREPFLHLDITADHAFAVAKLPEHHRDPFDRMLVAQCLVEGLALVTRDTDIKRYGIDIIEA